MTELQLALAKRGRTWGAQNDVALEGMRDELLALRRRPRTHALLINKALRGRRPIGLAQGGYVRGTGASD